MANGLEFAVAAAIDLAQWGVRRANAVDLPG